MRRLIIRAVVTGVLVASPFTVFKNRIEQGIAMAAPRQVSNEEKLGRQAAQYFVGFVKRGSGSTQPKFNALMQEHGHKPAFWKSFIREAERRKVSRLKLGQMQLGRETAQHFEQFLLNGFEREGRAFSDLMDRHNTNDYFWFVFKGNLSENADAVYQGYKKRRALEKKHKSVYWSLCVAVQEVKDAIEQGRDKVFRLQRSVKGGKYDPAFLIALGVEVRDIIVHLPFNAKESAERFLDAGNLSGEGHLVGIVEAFGKAGRKDRKKFFETVYRELRKRDSGGFHKDDYPAAARDTSAVKHLQGYLGSVAKGDYEFAQKYAAAVRQAMKQGIINAIDTGKLDDDTVRALAVYWALANGWDAERDALIGKAPTVVTRPAKKPKIRVMDEYDLNGRIRASTGLAQNLFEKTPLRTWLRIQLKEGYYIADWEGLVGYFTGKMAKGEYGDIKTDRDWKKLGKQLSRVKLDQLRDRGEFAQFLAREVKFSADQVAGQLANGRMEATVQLKLKVPIGSRASLKSLRANDELELERVKTLEHLIISLQTLKEPTTSIQDPLAAAIKEAVGDREVKVDGKWMHVEADAVEAIRTYLAGYAAANSEYYDRAWGALGITTLKKGKEFDRDAALALTSYVAFKRGTLRSEIEDWRRAAPPEDM